MVRRCERRLAQQVAAEKLGLVPVTEADAIAPGFRLADGGDGQSRIEVRGIVQALSGAQVHAARIPAALAQPDRMQREAPAVVQLDGEFLRRADMKTRHGRLR